MPVTCLRLGSQVTLETEKGVKYHFKAGAVLMIMFGDEDENTDYLVCAAGNGLPFMWVAKNHNHEKVLMELSEWQKLSKLAS
jgi:hypothetical protein